MAVVTADMVAELSATGASCRLDETATPRFSVGDHIVVRNINPPGHTRMPRCVRGKRGVVQRDHGVFIFPDTNAHAQGEKPQHVYSVRFTPSELWGGDASDRDSIYIDMWDDYMDLQG